MLGSEIFQLASANYGEALDDVELLRRHLDGCRRSFPELVRRYQRQLWWAVRSSDIPVEHQPDVVQEGLLRIHRFAGKFRGNSAASVGTWMVTIMRNVARTFWKKLGRHSAHTIAFEDYHSGQVNLGVGIMTHNAAQEDQTVVRMDIHLALKQLSPELRDVLVHTSLRGMSIEDYAVRADIPVGTVKSRRNRAKRQMLQLLRPQEYLCEKAS